MILNNYTHSLESRLDNYIFNVGGECNFREYLQPNEKFPERIKEHLDKGEEGIIVSAGTERSFFDLIFSDKCEGIVVRDINPAVKAYVDFNTLLLRISKTREEYLVLSHSDINLSSEDLEERVSQIKQRMESAILPTRMKDYYIKNISIFAETYLKIGKHWKQWDGFKECRYHLVDEQFDKLQKYAQAGNIVSTIGSINDLKFLNQLKVSIVDTSNIVEYEFLDLQIADHCHPRVVHYSVFQANYFSYVHVSLDSPQREEYETIIGKIYKTYIGDNEDYKGIIEKIFNNSLKSIFADYNGDEKKFSRFIGELLMDENVDKFDCQNHAIYSPKTLTLLKDIFETAIFGVKEERISTSKA